MPYEAQPKLALAAILDTRDEQMIALLQSVVALDPLNAKAHYDLAAAAQRQDKCDLAVASLSRSLELEPGQPNAYTMLARCALQGGDAVGWLENFQKSMALDPQDHEIPAHIAEGLFRLQLVEPAEKYLRRAQSIKPNSSYVKYVNFVGIDAQHGTERGLPAAWELVEEAFEDRKGSWYEPMIYVMVAADINGTMAATLRRLEKTYPGISDLSAADVTTRIRFIRLEAVTLWRSVYDRETLLSYVEAESGQLATEGHPDAGRFELKLLSGDVDAAAEFALNNFLAGAVPLEWPWRMYLQCPSNSSLLGHPRVAERVRRWDAEETQLRNQLSDYFAAAATGE